MFKFALSTFGAKITTSILNFILLVLISRYMGAAAVGEISMILLTVAIVVMASFLFGGSALVYLTPRYPILPLMIISYIWSFIVSAIAYIVLLNINVIEHSFIFHVVFLSFIASLFSAHFNLLLGKEKIHKVNLFNVLNVTTILLVFLLFTFINNKYSIWAYIYGMYISYGIIYLWSLIDVFKFIKSIKIKNIGHLIKDLSNYGIVLQLSNIALLFNYRGGYYFVEHFYSKASLGIYSVANQLSEASWMISRSFATVLYARVSNLVDDKEYKKTKYYVLSFFKIVFLVTMAIVIVLLVLPSGFYKFVFGSEFGGIKNVIWALSPGILLLSVSRILGVFFSGTGRAWHFGLGTFISLALLIGLLIWWVPLYGIIGAAWATSVSYVSLFSYYLILFIHYTHSSIKDFIVNRSDFDLFVSETKKIFKK